MKANLIIVCCAMTLWGCQKEDEGVKLSAFDACTAYAEQTFPDFEDCIAGRIELNPDFWDIVDVMCADRCDSGSTTREVLDACADSLVFTWDEAEQFCLTGPTKYSAECEQLYDDVGCIESTAWD